MRSTIKQKSIQDPDRDYKQARDKTTTTYRNLKNFRQEKARYRYLEHLLNVGLTQQTPKSQHHLSPDFIMCFRGEYDMAPPPRPRNAREASDPRYVQALERYADNQEAMKERKKRSRRNGAVAAMAASAGASG
jgi:hypothetical protein